MHRTVTGARWLCRASVTHAVHKAHCGKRFEVIVKLKTALQQTARLLATTAPARALLCSRLPFGVNRVTLTVGRPPSGLPRSTDILGVRQHVAKVPLNKPGNLKACRNEQRAAN